MTKLARQRRSGGQTDPAKNFGAGSQLPRPGYLIGLFTIFINKVFSSIGNLGVRRNCPGNQARLASGHRRDPVKRPE